MKKPLILGHEICGRVVDKGAAVRDLQLGDRVGVPWLHWSCGSCEFCREGNENLCAEQKITGVTGDGGYAEFARAPASHVVKIPSGLSSLEAAPLFCAGVTESGASMNACRRCCNSFTLSLKSSSYLPVKAGARFSR